MSSFSTIAKSTRRLCKELEVMRNAPPPGITADLKGDNIYELEATIHGPPNTPYEGGTFLLDITYPKDYPYKPPKVTFKTKIYHCNINIKGEIGLDILKDKWSPAMTVEKLLLSIQSLLDDCNPKEPRVPAIAKQYINNREEHDRMCREWTMEYAIDE